MSLLCHLVGHKFVTVHKTYGVLSGTTKTLMHR
jgi:hypothetical protein